MNDKYYIPDIEEFCVGFKFEFFCHPEHTINSDCDESEMKWIVSNNFNTELTEDYDTNPIEQVNYLLSKNRIRVKYLDEEDIESLGFELIDKKSSIIFDEPMEDYYRLYELGNNYIEYNSWYTSEIDSNNKRYPKKNEKYTIYSKQFIENENNFVTSIRFSGTIKNKSELKFILKSIGVLEENKI